MRNDLNWEYQKELFVKLNVISNKVRLLGGVIQNDLEKCLKEGYLTEQELADSIPEFAKDANEVMTELQELSPKIIELLQYWSSNKLNRIDWSKADQ